MKYIITLSFVLLNISFALAQNIDYSIDTTFKKLVPKENANFSKKTTYNNNGTITNEIKDLKQNVILTTYTIKDEEPFENVTKKTRIGKKILDYSFTLVYSSDSIKCDNRLDGITDFFKDSLEIEYIAPKIANGKDFTSYFINEIYYPLKASENNWMGITYVQFKISKLGAIENISIKKGSYIVLDKEAVRVIRNMKIASPAKLKNIPIDICLSLPITFQLSDE